MSLAEEIQQRLMAKLDALPELPRQLAIPALALRVIEDELRWRQRLVAAVTPLTSELPAWPKDGVVTLHTARGAVRLEAIADQRDLLGPP